MVCMNIRLSITIYLLPLSIDISIYDNILVSFNIVENKLTNFITKLKI